MYLFSVPIAKNEHGRGKLRWLDFPGRRRVSRRSPLSGGRIGAGVIRQGGNLVGLRTAAVTHIPVPLPDDHQRLGRRRGRSGIRVRLNDDQRRHRLIRRERRVIWINQGITEEDQACREPLPSEKSESVSESGITESGTTESAAKTATSHLRPCSHGQSQEHRRDDQTFAHGKPLKCLPAPGSQFHVCRSPSWWRRGPSRQAESCGEHHRSGHKAYCLRWRSFRFPGADHL